MTGPSAGPRTARLACIQMEPVVGRPDQNLEKALALLDAARREGADLAVLPELTNSGYVFETRAEAMGLAEVLPEGRFSQTIARFAADSGMIVVAGVAERAGDALYNSALVTGPDGYIGTYRKNHLWAAENLFFARGNLGVPVWPTRIGQISVAICYDIWFPEIFRLAALGGADLLCVPTNWVPMPAQPEGLPVMANILAMAGAHANGLFVAAADRVGTERGQPFLGRSLIAGPQGWPLAGPASADATEILFADVDLGAARRERRLNAFNDIIGDRRAEVYGWEHGAPPPASAVVGPDA
jgi:predicted amidohydrolase